MISTAYFTHVSGGHQVMSIWHGGSRQGPAGRVMAGSCNPMAGSNYRGRGTPITWVGQNGYGHRHGVMAENCSGTANLAQALIFA